MPEEKEVVNTPESAAVAEGAEVETPAKPADENLTGETAKPDQGDTPPKRKNWAQERINELTRQKHENERLAEHWRQVALARGEGKTEKPAPKADEDPEPKEEDYQEKGLGEYIKAHSGWAVRNAVREYEAKQESKSKAAQSQSEEQKQIERFVSSQDAARAKYPDFDEVKMAVDPELPMTEQFHKALMAEENSGELFYHLNKLPAEELAKITALTSPTAIGRAFGKLEAGIAPEPAGGSNGEEKPPEKPQTRAPNPPSLVRKASVGTKSFNPLDPSTWTDSKDYQKKMDEYEKKARS